MRLYPQLNRKFQNRIRIHLTIFKYPFLLIYYKQKTGATSPVAPILYPILSKIKSTLSYTLANAYSIR